MSISIKLPEDLRKRIARVVEDTDQSAHAFMVEAIRQETERAEKRRGFLPMPTPRARSSNAPARAMPWRK